MVDAPKDKGSVKKFATEERARLNAAVSRSASQDGKAAPNVGTPAAKPDIQPAEWAAKPLPAAPPATKSIVRK
ncbi:MAG: hypothetical protein JWN53_1105 [Gemmatimonadetes bacterium]|nr:hypothetical protein [Frankiales bacterium]MDB4899297.1 hypothetical protein [Gemmatimonadota bacterium]